LKFLWLNHPLLLLAVSLVLILSTPPEPAYAQNANPALFKAIEFDEDKELRQLLIKGANPNVNADDGTPALILAMQKGSDKAVKVLLLSRTLNVNAQDSHGDTALMLACLKDRPDWVSALLAREADLKQTGQWTPMHYAAVSGSVKSMRMLVEAGADINAFSPNGTTPLMMAAREGKEQAVRFLMSKGVDASVVNQSGFNAAGYAKRAKNEALAQELLKYAKARKDKGFGG